MSKIDLDEVELLKVNGHRVLYCPIWSTDLVRVCFHVKRGAIDELDGMHGAAHVLEHMAFKGSEKYPNPGEVARRVELLGGGLNAFTGQDDTGFHVTLLAEDFELGFDLISDMVFNPLLREEDLEKERNPILSEFSRRIDDPMTFLYEELLTEFYTGFRRVLGTENSIKEMNCGKLRAFHNNCYNQFDLLISVCGSVGKEKVRKQVYHLPRARGNLLNHHEQAVSVNTRVIRKRATLEEIYFMRMYRSVSSSRDNYQACLTDLINQVVGGSTYSLLFQRIREERGLPVYSVGSFAETGSSIYPVFCIYGSVSPEGFKECEEAVDACIDEFISGKADDEFLQAARKTLRFSLIERLETASGVSGYLTGQVNRGLSPEFMRDDLRNLEQQTAEELLEHGKRMFSSPRGAGYLHGANATKALDDLGLK